MKSPRIFLFLSSVLVLASCGTTKYVPMRESTVGTSTGYVESQLDSASWRVAFVANPATEMAVVNRYMLFRAAELTVAHGFDYFLVLDYWNNSNANAVGLEPNPSIVSCPDPLTTSSNIDKGAPWVQFREGNHSAAVTIRMIHGQCPMNNPRAYEAGSLIARMAPSIARGD